MGSEWKVTPSNLLDVRLSLTFLYIWGCWPSLDWTTLQWTLYRCLTAFSLGTSILFALTEVLALFDRESSMDTHVGNASALAVIVLGVLKVLILQANRIPVGKLISRLSSMHVRHGSGVPRQAEILKGAVWKAKLICGAFLFICFLNSIIWFVYPVIFTALTEDTCSMPHAQNETLNSFTLSNDNNYTNNYLDETNRILMNTRKGKNQSSESNTEMLPTENNFEGKLIMNAMSANINANAEIPELNLTNDDLNFKGTKARSNAHQQYLREKCMPLQLFPAVAWHPFDTTRDPGYSLVYALQVISIHISCVYNVGPDTLYVTMFIYITAQLKILNISIQNVRKTTRESNSSRRNSEIISHRSGHTNGRNSQLIPDWAKRLGSRKWTVSSSDDVERRNEDALIACIKHHQDIISSVSELESVISLSLLVQVIISMCVICVTLFSVVVGAQDTATVLKFTLMLLALFSQLFLVCWFADDIIWESLEVYNSAFGCDWPDGSRAFKQMILMLMLRAQTPLVITAGKFYVMSRSTFMQIVEASYSFFTVLSNVGES